MQISKLVPSRRVRDRWVVQLEDGSFLQVGKNQMADFALYEGRELTENELMALRQAERHERFEACAIRALMDTPMSRRKLIERLRRQECPSEEAQAIAGRMVELGLLDEAWYAAELARHYAGRGYGPRRVRDEFNRRGVSREYWEAALESVEDWQTGLDAFLAQKLAGPAPEPKDIRRVSAALVRRGYDWADINAGMRRLLETWEESAGCEES